MNKQDVIIIGAGAAGLMCAIEAGKRGRAVTVLEGSNKPGKKILMSGGGRCNFTNYGVVPDRYLSNNPHYCKSALSQYTQWDFIKLVETYGIEYYEKGKGELFCTHKARDILNMLLQECELAGVRLEHHCKVKSITAISDNHFVLETADTLYHTESVVIATGGLSIPTLGSSPYGYQIATQFGLDVVQTRAGLVPYTLPSQQLEIFAELPGVALPVEITHPKQAFKDNMLFTHRGLSGPSVLQISSYWQAGEAITIDLFPDQELADKLVQEQKCSPNKQVKNYLASLLPKAVVGAFLQDEYASRQLKQLNLQDITDIALRFKKWELVPSGTEGYKTAEVTLGGVNVNALSSKTMECKDIKGLYFIGEVVDVTGWLGGYNFQWAWSSGWVAGQYA